MSDLLYNSQFNELLNDSNISAASKHLLLYDVIYVMNKNNNCEEIDPEKYDFSLSPIIERKEKIHLTYVFDIIYLTKENIRKEQEHIINEIKSSKQRVIEYKAYSDDKLEVVVKYIDNEKRFRPLIDLFVNSTSIRDRHLYLFRIISKLKVNNNILSLFLEHVKSPYCIDFPIYCISYLKSYYGFRLIYSEVSNNKFIFNNDKINIQVNYVEEYEDLELIQSVISKFNQHEDINKKHKYLYDLFNIISDMKISPHNEIKIINMFSESNLKSFKLFNVVIVSDETKPSLVTITFDISFLTKNNINDNQHNVANNIFNHFRSYCISLSKEKNNNIIVKYTV